LAASLLVASPPAWATIGRMEREQKITLGEMRANGTRGLLIYCTDYRCSHSVTLSPAEKREAKEPHWQTAIEALILAAEDREA